VVDESGVIDRARLLVIAAVLLTACMYFAWRITVVNAAYPIFSWLVYAIELVGLLRTVMFLRSAIDVPGHANPKAPSGLRVDIAVTTYNEPIELVRPTLAAAVAIGYSHETWLLDDGSRAEMRALASELGAHYVSRTDRSHDKAGNLNNAIGQMHGDFLAIFDADHIADPRFLDRTLGYLDDAKLAFVQTPHEFRNHDSFDHLHRGGTMNAQSLFNYVVQPSRNPSHSSQYCSSAGVARRSAIGDRCDRRFRNRHRQRRHPHVAAL
jgi:cellulose synthase (UDP-forming)